MTRQELALLEKAFGAEIDAAFRDTPPLMQTRSKLAAKLVGDGLLVAVEAAMGGHPPLKVSGYMLTEAGRLAYCETCERIPDTP